MTVHQEVRYRRAPRVPWRWWRSTVLAQPRADEIVTLEGLAAGIWNLLERPASLAELVAAAPDAEVAATVQQLVDLGVVAESTSDRPVRG